MPEDAAVFSDPLSGAARYFFGLSYLFPYQRLVITNILEAAAARGISPRWPGETADLEGGETPVSPGGITLGASGSGDDPAGAGDTGPDSDRDSLGRQIVILPTGAGKSLCFQLPAMILPGITLVIYPILSLMADQERRLRDLSGKFSGARECIPVVLRGGQTREERDRIWEGLRSGENRFLIANPEVLLTAPVLEKITAHVFGGEGARRIIGNPDRGNISYAAQGCILKDLAVRDLIKKHSRPAIVFCSSRRGTERLARYLRNELTDREVRFYHAGLSREEKADLETWFFRSTGGVLTATCAYGMGVDKPDIRTVIHRDCPPSVEAYLQESGRAGRDGLPSRAILLWGPDDQGAMRRARSGADRERFLALMAYARNTALCRRGSLLSLLNYEETGERPESGCCDVCDGTARGLVREQAALTAFFQKNRRSYTAGEAAGVLAQAEAIGWSREEAKEAVDRLIREGVIKRLKNPLWKGKLTLSKPGRFPPDPQAPPRGRSFLIQKVVSLRGNFSFLGTRFGALFFGFFGRGKRRQPAPAAGPGHVENQEHVQHQGHGYRDYLPGFDNLNH
jgi:ATP-dependent DNA helicase RecQ